MKTMMITMIVALSGFSASAQFNEYGNVNNQYGPPNFTGGTVNSPSESFAIYAQNTKQEELTVIEEVSPNPSFGTSCVLLNTVAVNPVTIYIVDLNGNIQKTYTYDGGSSRLTFDISDLKDGLYSVQVQERGKSMQSVKLLKQS